MEGLKWAARVPASERPPILNKTHEDWPFGLRWVPRAWTAWFGDPPKKIEGNAPEFEFFYKWTGQYWKRCEPGEEGATSFMHPFPIPKPGFWWKGKPDYVASTDLNGIHVRSGYRWDDQDGYYQRPSFTVKQK